MLPPRLWPTRLWVSAVAVLLLLLHAIGLAVQLVVMHLGGGIPGDPDAARAPIAEMYLAQVTGGFAPGLIVLVMGLVLTIPATRDADERVVAWGRIFISGLVVLALILFGLGFPAWQMVS